MNYRLKLLFVLSLAISTAVTVSGQTPTSVKPAGVGTAMSGNGGDMRGTEGGGTISVTVTDEKMSRLDRQAVVRLYDENQKHNTWQPTSKGSDTTFDGLAVGKYEIDVNAIGYLTARKEVEIASLRKLDHLKESVVLHPDPDAVDLVAADASMTPKATKEAEKGITDLLTGKPKDSEKHMESALNQAPNSAHANFLLAYVLVQENDLDRAQASATKATSIDPHDIQAFNLLGRILLARHDFAGAKTILDQAATANPDNSTVHSLLADAYLNLGDYKNSLAQADLAIAKTKGGMGNAMIVRGEALAHLGRNDEAIQALNTYLQNAPDTAAGPQVEQMIASLGGHVNPPATTPAPTTKQ